MAVWYPKLHATVQKLNKADTLGEKKSLHESFRVALENVESNPSTQTPQQYLTQLLQDIEGPVHLYSSVCIRGARLVSFYMLLYSQGVDTVGSSAYFDWLDFFHLDTCFFPDANGFMSYPGIKLGIISLFSFANV